MNQTPGPATMRARQLLGGRASRTAIAALLIAASAVAGLQARAAAPAASTPPAEGPRNVSVEEYRQHLVELAGLVQDCEKARDAKACDPARVGPDDLIAIGASRRTVRYSWLRALFTSAQTKDAPTAPSARQNAQPAEPSTSDLLKDAKTRLEQDLAQSNAAALPASASHAQVRDTMKQVLAGREFRGLREPTARDTAMEKFANWLNQLFESAARLGARSAWIGRLAVWAFIVAVCVGLAWALLQMERRWRVRLVLEDVAPAPGSPSARAWAAWLNEAREAAAAGRFRDAIHSVYWAAISRLESRRLWPADRARTPREYLALMAPEDPRASALAALTRSFERVWYGGRTAAEDDYRTAEQVAAGLIASGGAAPAGAGKEQAR